MQIKVWLKENEDPKYRAFSLKLLPSVSNLIGVRLPLLRKKAKELAKTEIWREFLQKADESWFEEIMLKGFVIGQAEMSDEERLKWIAWFVPKINNWSVCDSFCNSLKFTKKNQAVVWQFLLPYFQKKEPYAVRFAVVMLLNYYLDEIYLLRALELLRTVDCSDYYVKMAVAWALSTAYVKNSDQVWPYFDERIYSSDVLQKTYQKIIESNRISIEQRFKIQEKRAALNRKKVH
ncbi:MAG TPA: DNA alkylation repair protein [Firmicutes bacterium]|nr:DNA alkylation repair protein [Bacillota bacterium]